jgi:hypothetical protein
MIFPPSSVTGKPALPRIYSHAQGLARGWSFGPLLGRRLFPVRSYGHGLRGRQDMANRTGIVGTKVLSLIVDLLLLYVWSSLWIGKGLMCASKVILPKVRWKFNIQVDNSAIID